jgi:hypothetical protein
MNLSIIHVGIKKISYIAAVGDVEFVLDEHVEVQADRKDDVVGQGKEWYNVP